MLLFCCLLSIYSAACNQPSNQPSDQFASPSLDAEARRLSRQPCCYVTAAPMCCQGEGAHCGPCSGAGWPSGGTRQPAGGAGGSVGSRELSAERRPEAALWAERKTSTVVVQARWTQNPHSSRLTNTSGKQTCLCSLHSAGGRSFPTALHFPWGRLSVGGDGGAGSGGPQGSVPGTLHQEVQFNFMKQHSYSNKKSRPQFLSSAYRCLQFVPVIIISLMSSSINSEDVKRQHVFIGVNPLAGGWEGAFGNDWGGGLWRWVICNSAGANPGPEDRHPHWAER